MYYIKLHCYILFYNIVKTFTYVFKLNRVLKEQFCESEPCIFLNLEGKIKIYYYLNVLLFKKVWLCQLKHYILVFCK